MNLDVRRNLSVSMIRDITIAKKALDLLDNCEKWRQEARQAFHFSDLPPVYTMFPAAMTATFQATVSETG